MKTFRTNQETVQNFLSQKYSSGQNQTGSIYFVENEIYSYGSHYLMGELLNNNGQTYLAVNDSGYSVTTNRHISLLMHEGRHFRQILLSEYDSRHVQLKLQDLKRSLDRARKPELYTGEVVRVWETYLSHRNWMGEPVNHSVQELITEFSERYDMGDHRVTLRSSLINVTDPVPVASEDGRSWLLS